MLHFLVYVSSATTAFSRAELDDILEISRRNNASLDVSGMLLYKDGNLMQVLEGEESTVRSLYSRIAQDPRHRGLMVLLEGPREEREYAGWTMAFRDLESPESRAVPGYSQFLNTPLDSPELVEDPSRCQRLLATFKRTM